MPVMMDVAGFAARVSVVFLVQMHGALVPPKPKGFKLMDAKARNFYH